MPFSNYIYEYYDGITTGKIVVGKWVRLIYEYIVSGLQNGLFLFNAKKANKARQPPSRVRLLEKLGSSRKEHAWTARVRPYSQ